MRAGGHRLGGFEEVAALQDRGRPGVVADLDRELRRADGPLLPQLLDPVVRTAVRERQEPPGLARAGGEAGAIPADLHVMRPVPREHAVRERAGGRALSHSIAFGSIVAS